MNRLDVVLDKEESEESKWRLSGACKDCDEEK